MSKNQRIWGPVMWRIIHLVCMAFDKNRGIEADDVLTFLLSLCYVLPCGHCRETYTALISIDNPTDVVKKQESLFLWSYNVHEHVNKKLWVQKHKNVPYTSHLSYEEARRKYDDRNLWLDDVMYFYNHIIGDFYKTSIPWYYTLTMVAGKMFSTMDARLACFDLPDDDPTYQYDTFKSKEAFVTFIEKVKVYLHSDDTT